MTPPPTDSSTATLAPPPTQSGLPDDNASPSRDVTPEIGIPGPEDKLETLREILVGDQVQALAARFQGFERELDAHYARLGNELMTKFEALKVLSKTEIDDLGKSVAQMIGQLQKEDHSLSRELEESTRRVAELEQRVEEMSETLSTQVRRMQDEFTHKMAEFSRLIEDQQKDAAKQAVSRSEFSRILSGLAGSLAQDEAEGNPGADPAEE